MFSFHKPKIYRSLTGCCICRAKSSSSRFTDSSKYQPHFGACFHLKEERSGDICNACVLLVKRFRKLPVGLQQRHWGHVVDARANTKVRPKLAEKAQVVLEEEEEEEAADEVDEDDDIKLVSKVSIRKKKKKREEKSCWERRSCKIAAKLENQMPSFLDPQLWHREKVCCGTIFRGPMNAIVIDTNHFRPCISRRSSSGQISSPVTPTTPPASTASASTSASSSSSSSSSSPIHFKMESPGDEAGTEETDFSHRPFDNKNGHSKMAVPAAL